MAPEEAGRLEGADPDYAQRDLYNAIKNKNFPSWSMFIQVMTFDEAEKFKFNPFDLTKVSQKIIFSSHCKLLSRSKIHVYQVQRYADWPLPVDGGR